MMQGSHPGTIIHDPIISGANTLNESMKISFSILEGGCGILDRGSIAVDAIRWIIDDLNNSILAFLWTVVS